MEPKIQQLQDKLASLADRARAIENKADVSNRAMTDAEVAELDGINAEFASTEKELATRKASADMSARAATPQRVTRPSDPAPQASGEPRQRITGGDKPGVTKGSWGWQSMAEFTKAVKAAAIGDVDGRILAAASTYGSEGSNADGGYAVPPDFRETIIKKVQGEESLLSRTDQQIVSVGNRIVAPMDNTTPWQASGGILVVWDDEAAQLGQTKPALGQFECKLNKMTALVPLTDEMLEDAPSISRYLPGKVADKFTSKINDSIVNGNGVSKPQGLLNSPSKLAQTKEAGQAAGTLVYANIVKMWSRMYAPLRGSAVWLINQDIEPQLFSMVAPGATIPAYLPPNGLSGSPFATLMGRPVIPVEATQTLGTEGDIIFAALGSYCTVQKSTGVKQDVSMHVYFDQSVTAFRFIMRMGGQSWMNAPIVRQNGTNTLSNVVTLQNR